jgi:hypothetical protein
MSSIFMQDSQILQAFGSREVVAFQAKSPFDVKLFLDLLF